MGTPTFAKTVLESLVDNDYNVVLVVTQPDKPIGRKKIITPSPVKEYALSKGIEIFQPKNIRKDYQKILEYEADLIITAAYGQIIPLEVLKHPKFSCVNLHASLLPKYRGGSPIQRAIINGEKTTGVSLMYMSEKMDEGDVLAVSSIEIADHDTSTTLFLKLAKVAANLIIDSLPLLFKGKLKAIPQDHLKATYAYNLNKTDEFINFNRNVLDVYNQIRGMLDNPGAYGIINNKKIKFHKVSYTRKVYVKAKKIYGVIDNNIVIGCKDGSILVEKIQPEGKKVMDAKSFFNGYGDKLKEAEFDEFKD